MARTGRIPWVALLALALGATGAHAAGAGDPCGPGVRERLDFLEERLEETRRHGTWWQRVWLGVYGGGLVVQSLRAGFEDDGGERADLIVSAVKSVVGVTRMLVSPTPTRLGADPMRGVPADDRAGCLRRLERGEAQLRANARQADTRWAWQAHAANVGINVAGALVAGYGFDEEAQAWESAGIGIAVGEMNIWSHPWRARADWDEYESRFPALAPSPGASGWQLVPAAGGVALRLRF